MTSKTSKTKPSTKTPKLAVKKTAKKNDAVDPLENMPGYREHSNALAAKDEERAEFAETCSQAAERAEFAEQVAKAAEPAAPVTLTEAELDECSHAVHATYQTIASDAGIPESAKPAAILEVVLDADYVKSYGDLSEDLYRRFDAYVQQVIKSEKNYKAGLKKLVPVLWNRPRPTVAPAPNDPTPAVVDAEVGKAAEPTSKTKKAPSPKPPAVLAAPVQAALDELRTAIGKAAADTTFQLALRDLGARTVTDGNVGPYCIKLAGKFAAETLLDAFRKQAATQTGAASAAPAVAEVA